MSVSKEFYSQCSREFNTENDVIVQRQRLLDAKF